MKGTGMTDNGEVRRPQGAQPDGEEKAPISPVLKGMEVGDECRYPLSRMSVVKSVCSQVALTTGRVFKTKIARPHLIVKRVE